MALPGETVSTGAPIVCRDCGQNATIGVYYSAAGHYVGYYCGCGPYSRESGYYKSRNQAQRALDSGAFTR